MPERTLPPAEVFIAVAQTIPRGERDYSAWLDSVTRTFKHAWTVIEEGAGRELSFSEVGKQP